MAKDNFTLLTQDNFKFKLLPFFIDTKSKILELLDNDKKWSRYLNNLFLVYINNSNYDKKSYLYLSKKVNDNLYIENSDSIEMYYGYSNNRTVEEFVYGHIVDCLRYATIDYIISLATPGQLAGYFTKELESVYRSINIKLDPKYIHLTIPNFTFSDKKHLFAISAFRTNLIFPTSDSLNSSEIKDNTADNKKILITNKKDTSGFENFDHLLGLEHLITFFDIIHFTGGVHFYKEVLNSTYKSVFDLVDILKTTGSMKIYDFKKKLASLEVSDGNKFENYLTKLLKICLSPDFDDLDIKKRHPNRGRLRIRDFIITNNSKSSFLNSLKTKGVDFLLFDAKNYSKELTTRDLDTFKEYLEDNIYFGKVGFILSRNGVSVNCEENIFRKLQRGTRIVVLDEEDLMMMLENINCGRSAIDIIERKYNELLLQL